VNDALAVRLGNPVAKRVVLARGYLTRDLKDPKVVCVAKKHGHQRPNGLWYVKPKDCTKINFKRMLTRYRVPRKGRLVWVED